MQCRPKSITVINKGVYKRWMGNQATKEMLVGGGNKRQRMDSCCLAVQQRIPGNISREVEVEAQVYVVCVLRVMRVCTNPECRAGGERI
jgi:hypothetical protein